MTDKQPEPLSLKEAVEKFKQEWQQRNEALEKSTQKQKESVEKSTQERVKNPENSKPDEAPNWLMALAMVCFTAIVVSCFVGMHRRPPSFSSGSV